MKSYPAPTQSKAPIDFSGSRIGPIIALFDFRNFLNFSNTYVVALTANQMQTNKIQIQFYLPITYSNL